ncbi:hypothetical protein POVCU1_046900 [Plasmodium ovale curtisi]|uniref:Uncharacterized protein n=1 Tax=Plasmodium ovale curtisi TaxID=864141 RepID=A0A1A8X449_PLAOA|nr:hypothetical protein POVCU1_046900 [Plasmodium ovale curtisi]
MQVGVNTQQSKGVSVRLHTYGGETPFSLASKAFDNASPTKSVDMSIRTRRCMQNNYRKIPFDSFRGNEEKRLKAEWVQGEGVTSRFGEAVKTCLYEKTL